ncbi:MAG: 2-hydroxychromene-2-carboxylate isomerase family protein, partial [uncultured Ramlibacter sp.]
PGHHSEAHHLLPRLRFALCVPRLRAAAPGAGGTELRGGVPADPVRRAVEAPWPARPGRDPGQARVDVPAGALAGACARHRDADAVGAPVQPARVAAAGRGARVQSLCLRNAVPPRLARWRRSGRSGAAAGAAAVAGADARARFGPGEAGIEAVDRPGHRGRPVRRAHVRRGRQALLGLRRVADAAGLPARRCLVRVALGRGGAGCSNPDPPGTRL